MELQENSTASHKLLLPTQSAVEPHPGPLEERNGGNAYLYIIIVMSFYGVFLSGIMLGYFRSKRREKRRVNIFTRLVHEEEQREWGALPRKHSFMFPNSVPDLAPAQGPLPFCANHGNLFGHLPLEGALPSPLACVLCTEQSSVSSLCSSGDTRFTIEEESDSGTAEGSEENMKGGSETSGEDSG